MQLITNTLIEFSLIGFIAVYLYFMYALTRSFYVNLASYFSIGGYVLYLIYSVSGNLLIGLFLGGLTGLAVAFLCEKFLFKPFYEKKSSSLVLLMVYLSSYLLFANLLGLLFGNDMKFLGVSPKVISIFGANITLPQLALIIFFMFVLVFIGIIYKFSKIGLKIRALGQDSELAQVFGIDVYKFRYIFAMLAGFSLGIVGGLYTWDIGMEPFLSFNVLLYSMVAFIVGGTDSFLGTVIGSFLISLLKNFLSTIIPIYFVDVIVYSVLFIMLLFRPYGLFGGKVRVEES